jgi:hypothetical protein
MFSLPLQSGDPQLPLIGKESEMTSIAPANPLPHVSSLVQSAYEHTVNASGALNPMQLFVVMPGREPVPNLAAADSEGRAAVASIDAALGFRAIYSSKVADALTSARTEALAGVNWLHVKAMAPIDYGAVAAPKFDAAAHWLNIAGDLLALDGGTPFRPFH